MSTQDDSGISFEISKEQQNFRLLELPPSLLASLVSEDPPKYVLSLKVREFQNANFADVPESVWLKSAESPNVHHSEQPSPSAVLCTHDRTYQLRQVQSSNSVFILQPSESSRGNDRSPSQSLLAIAQCTSTLELLPSDTAASFALVLQLLKKTLPLYKGADTDVELGTDTTLLSKRKRAERSNAKIFGC